MYDFDHVTYNIDIPWLLHTQITGAQPVQDRMIACIEQQLERNPNYHGGYTFEVKDPCHDFAQLYNTFFSIVSEFFSPFNLSVKQRNYCWANVYNQDTYRSNLHNHILTSSVNAVFYLKMPTDSDGGLRIVYEDQELIYLPNNLDLIIMPSWVAHEPLPVASKNNRIAINMEIATVEDVDSYYTINKILRYAKPTI